MEDKAHSNFVNVSWVNVMKWGIWRNMFFKYPNIQEKNAKNQLKEAYFLVIRVYKEKVVIIPLKIKISRV